MMYYSTPGKGQAPKPASRATCMRIRAGKHREYRQEDFDGSEKGED